MTEKTNELLPDSIENFKPGEIHQYKNTSGLAPFEEMIAEHIRPDMPYSGKVKWDNRAALSTLITALNFKGHKYNGKVQDICLEIVPDPLESILSASDDPEKRFLKDAGVPKSLKNGFTEVEKKRPVGVILSADAYSSGSGIIGQLRTEIWYIPSSSGSGINRYMTKPIIETILDNPNACQKKIGSVAARDVFNPGNQKINVINPKRNKQ